MKATVKVANPNRGMYAAEIDGRGEYVIFELLDSSAPELGDIVAHQNFYSMGSETLSNLTQRCEIDVFVQNVCGPILVKKRCFL